MGATLDMRATTHYVHHSQESSGPYEVPEGWKARKLRNILKRTNERNRPDWPLLSVVRERGVILRDTENDEENHNFIPDDLTNYRVVRKGQFAMNKMKAWQGSYGISPMDGIVSPAYFVFDVRSVDNGYFHRAIRSRAYIPFFQQASDGVRIGQWDLSPEQMREIPFLIPPADEQAAIVRFLDHADEQIQRYIAAKERLIALLDEERQALVHQAVTRGLDPGVRFKPSGLEWLGDVPEHWEVVPFKRRVGFQEGPGIMAADFRESGVPLLRISCLRGPVATLDGCNYLDPDVVHARWSHFAIKEGDYLLSASASTGAVSLATSKVANCVPYTGIIRLWSASPRTVMPYVRLFLSSRLFLDQVDSEKAGVAISHFGPTHLSRMVMTLPPEPEQQAIVEYIDRATEGIDIAITRALRQIDLMNEYRTRLIADVVTGQLDVRAASANLRDPLN